MSNNEPVRAFIDALANLRAYDVSPVYDTNMPGWYTHPTFGIIRDGRNFGQNGYFAQTLVMSEHTGSHVDAPRHNHPGLDTIDSFPADALIGPYKKFDLTQFELEAGVPVSLAQLKEVEGRHGFSLEPGDVALLQFGWDRYLKPESTDPTEREWWGRNEPGLTEDACKYLADSGVRAVGSDTAAVDICVLDGVIKSAFGHAEYFLPRNILIMEGFVRLDRAPASGVFFAAPLKIAGGSGSPIRPILFG